ncbi:MAG: MarC family protein [Candidatus Thermoplasmatota archaeon]|nr:MarC family protein [Candidatus Thermoplasmatota archaeon]
MSSILFFVTVFVAVFSVLNPIGAIPTLMALTENYTPAERKRVIKRSITIAGGVVIAFMFIGIYIFSVLGINLSDFEVAGGILLFKVAFDMLQGKTSNTKMTSAEEQDTISREAVGVVPLGMPLLAGPGTITTTMIYFNLTSNSLGDKMFVLLAVILTLIAAFVILRFSTILFKRLGKTGSLVISRIMGLLLAAIGIGFISHGIFGIYQQLV